MYYYIDEVMNDKKWMKSAGSKARKDANIILESKGFKNKSYNLDIIENEKNRILKRFTIEKQWKNIFVNLKQDDVLFIQYPLVQMSYTIATQINKVKKRGIKVILLIHDSNILRENKMSGESKLKKIRMYIAEKSIFNSVNKIICHNNKMKMELIKLGLNEKKIEVLNIFDYLMDRKPEIKMPETDKTVIVAGALYPEKSGYVYDVPKNIKFNFYGVGYDTKKQKSNNSVYCGSFNPDELPYKLEGSYGLIWDGPSIEACKGAFGEYLKVNNPHKTSLYLASGIPVIIWKEAALAEFVKKNNCGLIINNLNELPDILNGMTTEQYFNMKESVNNISEKLRKGYYLSSAIDKCI